MNEAVERKMSYTRHDRPGLRPGRKRQADQNPNALTVANSDTSYAHAHTRESAPIAAAGDTAQQFVVAKGGTRVLPR